MDIRNIKTFITVAELESFTKAANEMNYAQSTVTMQIQQLERELDYPLFDRIGKKVSLTPLGTEFLKSAYEIIHIVEKSETFGKDVYNIHSKLRIGVTESLLFDVLMKILPDFKKKFNNLEISIKTGHLSELLTELKQNKIDLVYVSADINPDNELKTHYRRKEEIIFVSEKNHPLANKKDITLEEVSKYSFILTESDGYCNEKLKKYMSTNENILKISVEVDSVYVISQLVNSGMGLAFLPEFFIKNQLENGSLVKLCVDTKPQYYYSQIITHKNRWLSPFICEFIEMIKNTKPEK